MLAGRMSVLVTSFHIMVIDVRAVKESRRGHRTNVLDRTFMIMAECLSRR